MKQFKSLNLQTPRGQIGLKNLSLFPIDLPIKSHYYSPRHSQFFSIPSNENLQKNPTFPIKDQIYQNDIHKDKNEINIRLKIQSEIIQHHYQKQQLHNEKKSSSNSIITNEELLSIKDNEISKLKKDLANTKYQISTLLNEKNIRQTIDRMELSDYNHSERLHKMSLLNQKKLKASPIKTSSIISKNVRQFFKNNLQKAKTQSLNQFDNIQNLNYLISPKHGHSTDYPIEKDNKFKLSRTNSCVTDRNIPFTLEVLKKRSYDLFDLYLQLCSNNTNMSSS